jgi:uncharacterized protein (TIGR03435 family)
MTNRIQEQLDFDLISIAVKLAFSLTVFAFAINLLSAQSPVGEMTGTSKSMSFDSVSIRPADPKSTAISEWGIENNRFYIRNSPLTFAIFSAFYDRGTAPPDFIKSIPKWVLEEKFDITAKISDSYYELLKRETNQSAPRIPSEMLHSMLRNMLKERFNLVVHSTKGVMTGYSLEVGKRGINPKKLRVSTASESVPNNAIMGGETWLTTFEKGEDGQNNTRSFYRMTMREFASHLSSKALVTDNTGLTDRYDFSVELVEGTSDVSKVFNVEPLGLKLKKIDFAVEEIVIDRIDHPTPN